MSLHNRGPAAILKLTAHSSKLLAENLLFVVGHAVDEGLDAFDRHSVVDGGAEAANRTVTLDLHEAAGLCKFDEVLGHFVVLFVGHDVLLEDERNVHEGAVFLGGSTDEHLGGVDGAVEEGCLFAVDLFDSFDTTHVLEPLEGAVHGVDGEYRRSIEHVLAVDVGLEVEHGRNRAVNMPEEVLADDGNCDTCAGDVLLGAAVDHAEVRDVHLAGEEVGAHVGDEEAGLRLREVVPFRTVDGVVRRNVEVLRVVAQLEILVDVVVHVGLRGACNIHVTEKLCFLQSLGCPHASVGVVGSFVLAQQVHRNHAEQEGAAAAEEHDVVVLGDAHEVAKELFGFGEHVFNGL